MTWKGIWEGIAFLFENVLFIPYDALRSLELDSWWLANFFSWVFLIIGSVAFVYWMIQLKKFDENEESTYTYNENPK
ncbi:uracil phosphoribosyltransferase [Aequorivita sp. SDUM287046]|uniref:Uracil phosphoribosyltransferase n=1 Tax=Aequorivita aurantiaca TaxID=3053356 RepID=A0ABT8DEA6_9FLAO|nr:uracil phosphoribosyltransferase [Aequorivita aurantiaca]MDN3723118.1 uracil phosphoribosyltransferase [Aequorivita aurantiaca]